MERAAIIGVYDFIGYALCQSLLENGVEIEGIDLTGLNQQYKEEKRLEIGRNANFLESRFREWTAAPSVDALFITFYEQRPEEDRTFDDWKRKLEKIEGNHVKAALVLPAAMAEKTHAPLKFKEELASFFSKKEIPLLEFYVPTVYGPWQPEEYLFQQTLIGSEGSGQTLRLGDFEWIHDAIFVDDAVELILKTAEKEQAGAFLLSSGEGNHWLECASSLLGTKLDKVIGNAPSRLEMMDGLNIVKVDRKVSINTGISKQKQHYLRIQESRG